MGLTGSTNEERIWNFLIGKGLSKAGAAGLMGNLYAESALNPKNLQNSYEKKLGYTDDSYTAAVDNGSYGNFVKDKAGYGLAQWTYWSRKQNMLEFARAAGKSIGDLEMQLDFLFKELTEGYKAVLSVLKTATTVKAASDSVLLNYERPADQSDAVKTKRASHGQTYYNKYAGATSQPGNGGTNMSNSGLVNCTVYSPNHSGKRTHALDTLTPHCVVGQLSAETIGACFPKGREASCNYGIGYDGRVCLIVDECNRSWCTSSNANVFPLFTAFLSILIIFLLFSLSRFPQGSSASMTAGSLIIALAIAVRCFSPPESFFISEFLFDSISTASSCFSASSCIFFFGTPEITRGIETFSKTV